MDSTPLSERDPVTAPGPIGEKRRIVHRIQSASPDATDKRRFRYTEPSVRDSRGARSCQPEGGDVNPRGMWVLTTALAADPSHGLVPPLGADRLSEVGELRFTFNVERDGALATSRSWAWRPAEGKVTRTVDGASLTFRAGAPANEAERKADAQFVNDSFWLMPQLHVGWAGPDLTVVDHGPAPLPLRELVGEGTARKVELRYSATGGGYTPGDAYDLYLGEDGRIVVWSFRKGGAPEPTLTTTFERYVTAGPLQIATEHRSADGRFRLYFTDVRMVP